MGTNEQQSLLSLIQDLDSEAGDRLSKALKRLRFILSSEAIPRVNRRRAGRQIATYLTRKADALDPATQEISTASLRDLRNQLIHSHSRGTLRVERHYRNLWTAIGKMAPTMKLHELENLLAYCFGRASLDVSKSEPSPSRLVSVYHKLFDALDSESQRRIFRELLVRLFANNETAHFLNR